MNKAIKFKLEDTMERCSHIEACDPQVLHTIEGIIETIGTMGFINSGDGVCLSFELYSEIIEVLEDNMFLHGVDRNNDPVIDLLEKIKG